MSSTGARPIRGLTYANVSGYKKYPPMAGDTDGYRNFLTDIGIGWTYNSWDLRAIPADTLLSQLYPMMADPEEYFYLDYKGSPKLTGALLDLGYEFDKDLPRKSSSYILSSSFIQIDRNRRDGYRTKITRDDSAVTLLAWVSEVVRSIESRYTPKDENGYPTQGLNDVTGQSIVKLKETIATATSELKDFYLTDTDYQNIRQQALTAAKEQFDAFNNVQKFLATNRTYYNDPPNTLILWILDALRDDLTPAAQQYAERTTPKKESYADDDARILAEMERIYPGWSSFGFGLSGSRVNKDVAKIYHEDVTLRIQAVTQQIPEDFYSKIDPDQPLIQSIKSVIEALDRYVTEVVKLCKKRGAGEAASTSVVVRFYPAAAVVAEPLYGVNTVPLSEHSFLQVATPQNNIAVQFMSCAALDTPDTQWRQLYAEIFKTIMRYGNPKCSVCAGRYIVKDCHLASVPDLSNAFNTVGTFNFGLISENWDSSRNDVVNYIG